MVCTFTGVGVGRSNYYTEVVARGDYYKEGGEAPGRWYGKGAWALNLDEEEIGYKSKALYHLMRGVDPGTGERLRNVSLHTREYKAFDRETGEETVKRSEPKLAWDFTFSAPKSVSLLWGASDDLGRARIEACHRKAVETAISAIEEKASFTRTGKGGVNEEPLAVAFAAFDHSTSRALDPHLHTHVLLLNTGIREDMRGGAVDARRLFETGVHTFGAIYQNTLRHELTQTLGLSLYERRLEKGRVFEIDGVPEALMTESSKRRLSIQEAVEKKEESLGRPLNSYEKDEVFRHTRETKRGVDKDALRLTWQREAASHGFSPESLFGRAPKKTWTRDEENEFLRHFTRSLSYKEKISDGELLKTALLHSKGRLSQEEIVGFIDSYRTTHLRKASVDEKKGQFYTLNGIGLLAATKASKRSPYEEFRFAVNREVSRFQRWRYEWREKSYKRRDKAFRRRVTFLHLLGKIDRKTYNRLVHEKGLPKTRLGVQWEYATGKISRKQRDFFLRRIDPKREEKLRDREARIERWEKEREKREALRVERINRVSPYLGKEELEELSRGRLSLTVIERNLEREGKISSSSMSYAERKAKREREALERERVTELRGKGLITRETETLLLTKEVSLHDVETHLYRNGKLETLPPLVRLAETEKREMAELQERGRLTSTDRELIELGIETVRDVKERIRAIERIAEGRNALNVKAEAERREARERERAAREEALRIRREERERYLHDAKREREEGKAQKNQKQEAEKILRTTPRKSHWEALPDEEKRKLIREREEAYRLNVVSKWLERRREGSHETLRDAFKRERLLDKAYDARMKAYRAERRIAERTERLTREAEREKVKTERLEKAREAISKREGEKAAEEERRLKRLEEAERQTERPERSRDDDLER